MTMTVRKCDFCGKEITFVSKCRTVMVLKSHKDCIDPLSNMEFDICHSCIEKMFNCLHNKED